MPTESPTFLPTAEPRDKPVPLPTEEYTPFANKNPSRMPTVTPNPLSNKNTTPLPSVTPTSLPTSAPAFNITLINMGEENKYYGQLELAKMHSEAVIPEDLWASGSKNNPWGWFHGAFDGALMGR